MSLGMETAELAGAAVRVDPKTDKPHVGFSEMMRVWDLPLARGAKQLGVSAKSLSAKWKKLGCGSWGERAVRSETHSAKLSWLQVNADMWRTAKVVQVLCLSYGESRLRKLHIHSTPSVSSESGWCGLSAPPPHLTPHSIVFVLLRGIKN